MDVSFLEPVLSAPGPFATVCADVTHTTENAGTELDLRVRAIAERLVGAGRARGGGRRRCAAGCSRATTVASAGTLRAVPWSSPPTARWCSTSRWSTTPRREVAE